MLVPSCIRLASILTLAAFSVSALPAADDEPKPIPGIGPTGKIVKLHTGFKFTEGPAADRDGNVYFSDIPNERIHKVDAKGQLSVFREKSNRANGLMVNAKGEIVACEMAGRVVAISPDGKDVRILADKYDGKQFNAAQRPRDRQAAAASTSPTRASARPKPLPQGKTAVYYIAPDGKVTG